MCKLLGCGILLRYTCTCTTGPSQGRRPMAASARISGQSHLSFRVCWISVECCILMGGFVQSAQSRIHLTLCMVAHGARAYCVQCCPKVRNVQQLPRAGQAARLHSRPATHSYELSEVWAGSCFAKLLQCPTFWIHSILPYWR